jgi:hypothetical protein
MRFRAITDNGDWVFGNGQQAYVRDNLAIKYDMETKLRTFLNECFFAPEIGVPWFQLLGAKDQNALILSLQQVIANVVGVTKITDVQFELTPDRDAKVSYNINTIYTTQQTGTVTV